MKTPTKPSSQPFPRDVLVISPSRSHSWATSGTLSRQIPSPLDDVLLFIREIKVHADLRVSLPFFRQPFGRTKPRLSRQGNKPTVRLTLGQAPVLRQRVRWPNHCKMKPSALQLTPRNALVKLRFSFACPHERVAVTATVFDNELARFLSASPHDHPGRVGIVIRGGQVGFVEDSSVNWAV